MESYGKQHIIFYSFVVLLDVMVNNIQSHVFVNAAHYDYIYTYIHTYILYPHVFKQLMNHSFTHSFIRSLIPLGMGF